MEDKELIGKLQRPETCREAFGEVIRLYTEPLYKQVRRIVQRHEDADDVLQNVFMKAWQNIDNFRGEAKLSTWLHKIAINESMSFLERERKHAGVSMDDEEAFIINLIEADKNIDGDELAVLLRKAIAKLPEKQRLVFNMRYFDEMKYEQMSEILGTSESALKASYHHAVKKIEQFFRESD
ncbi:MAG: sigma-70 family RNA polymerase sigma factor [Duncaniella sp.]|nr:sigma-70 family RNA polymerase sigma factor [Duncaniella sp.]